MDEQDTLFNCRTWVGVKADKEDLASKDFVWIWDVYYPPSLIYVSVWAYLWFSCWSSKWPQKPTWKCHCKYHLRYGTAHSEACGEDDKVQGQQTSCLAVWLLCVSFLFTLKFCVQSLSLPTGWISHLPAQEHGKREKSKTYCPRWDTYKQHGDIARARNGGSERHSTGLSPAVYRGGAMGYSFNLQALIYSSVRWEQQKYLQYRTSLMAKWKIHMRCLAQCLLPSTQ